MLRRFLALLLCCLLLPAPAPAEEDPVDALMARFGLICAEELPYLPSLIDPVSVLGHIAIAAGYSDGRTTAIYGADEARLEMYLGYLGALGYEVTAADGAPEGLRAWHAKGPANGRQPALFTDVEILHDGVNDLLIVRYDYLDAWIADEWLWRRDTERTSARLPRQMPLEEGLSVTVEEVRFVDWIAVNGVTEPDVAPYTPEYLAEIGVGRLTVADKLGNPAGCALFSTGRGAPLIFPCVRISFDESRRDEVLRRLRGAAAREMGYRYDDCGCLHMLLMDAVTTDRLTLTPPASTGSELWMVFPPRYYEDGDRLALWLTLADESAPWLADPRAWQQLLLPVQVEASGAD